MLVNKTHIGVVDKKFAQLLIIKNTTFASHKPLSTFKVAVVAFLSLLNFIYAFPLILVKRSVSLSQSTHSILNTIEHSASQNASPRMIGRGLVDDEYKCRQVAFVNQQIVKNYAAITGLLGASLLNVLLRERLVPIQKNARSPVSRAPFARFFNQFSLVSIEANFQPPLKHVLRLRETNNYGRTLVVRARELSGEKVKFKTAQGFSLSRNVQFAEPLKMFSERKFVYSQINASRRRKVPYQITAGTPQPSRSSSFVSPVSATESKTRPFIYDYSAVEHVINLIPQIMNETAERILAKTNSAKREERNPTLDVNRLADKVCQLIERRARIERERRGL